MKSKNWFFAIALIIGGFGIGFGSHGLLQKSKDKALLAALDPKSGPTDEILKVRFPLAKGEQVLLRVKTVTIAGETHQLAVAELDRIDARGGDNKSRYFGIRVRSD